MQHADDERLARIAAQLRRRQKLGRLDLVGAGRSRHFGRRLENGEADRLRWGDIRDHFAQLGARARIVVWWNGAALDRLLDQEHAALVEQVVVQERRWGWQCEAELTSSEYGERGSIDVFGALEAARAVVVNEVKSDWGSIEETLRRLDVKARLAPVLAERAFGFRATSVGRVLILPGSRTARRIADRHAATLATALPHRNREVKAWLRQPSGPLRGLWFLSEIHASGRGSASGA
jgi:hypothetical protein